MDHYEVMQIAVALANNYLNLPKFELSRTEAAFIQLALWCESRKVTLNDKDYSILIDAFTHYNSNGQSAIQE